MKKIVVSVLMIFSILITANTNLFAQNKTEKAIFAGGCFWCMESDFEKLNGVKAVISGYSGGTGADPDYYDYIKKGHIEVVEVEFDPSAISYDELVNFFWRHIDPTDADGQFCDRGYAYSTGIFYLDNDQKKIAEASKLKIDASNILPSPIVTQITQANTFYPAEEYHQDYYRKNSFRYNVYRFNCGRDRVIKKLWGKSHY